MAGTTHRFQRGVVLAILGALCATSLIPTATSADTNLVIGGQAVIAYANGDQVRLRQDIGYESTVVANYGEGTWVTVLDGPFTDSEGAYWYQVAVGDVNAGGKSGFMVAEYLALDGGVSLETVAAVEEDPPAETSAPATGAVIGIAYVAGTNGDGVRCRSEASSSSLVITVLPEDTVIELTGAPIDIWQPVNCGGSGGYVSLAFVSYEPPAPEQAPVVSDEPASVDTVEQVAPAPEASVTGSLIVTGTNGDGVRCRASAGYDGNVVTVLAEGTSVDLSGPVQGEWQPVFCGGVNGYVFATFLGAVASDPTGSDAVSEEAMAVTVADVGGPTGMGMVSGTNGDGVRCRSEASTTSSTIMVLQEGADVTLRGGVQGDWQPVLCANQNGFVFSLYVTAGGSAGDTPSNTEASASVSTGTARVISTGGLNCRTAGSMTASVIMVLANNSTVSLRSGSTSGWQAVICGGQNGFASRTYLDLGSVEDNGSTDPPPSSSDGSSAGYSAGTQLQVTNTDGGGLRLRSAAGYSGTVLSVIGEGVGVTVRSGSTGDWVAVTYNGTNGFVHMDYVRAGTGTSIPTTPTTPSNPSPTSSLGNGDHASVTASLNLRYEASYSSGVAAVAPAGTVVLITGSPSNGFYPMNWDGLMGFMHGDYLRETTAALSERGGSANQPTTPPGGTQSGTGAGNSIVDYAMRYLGYPYVWATAGPGSFDCSGFTYWVAKNVLGKEIGRGLFTQIAAGRAVSRSALLPGDYVYFQNTYTTGLSHAGIYIGNNQFIHAENPSTGVRISDLNSQYYSSRWYGAVRLT